VAVQEIQVLEARAGVGTGISSGLHRVSAGGSSAEFRLKQLP